MPAKRSSHRVAAAQINALGSLDDNVAKVVGAIAQAARRRADSVLLPECAVTGYQIDFAALGPKHLRQALRQVGDTTKQHQINVLVGSPVFVGRRMYNCVVVFDRRGQAVYAYAKNQLTPMDSAFTPGNAVALFELDGVKMTTVICHERRYPELVRLAVMGGAQVLWHPNAGLDKLSISKAKRGGRDGVAARAFENAVYYVFANTVGPQGGGKWSAGDSKVVAPNEKVLALADNQTETVVAATLDLTKATRVYAERSRNRPPFLAKHWRRILRDVRQQSKRQSRALLGALKL